MSIAPTDALAARASAAPDAAELAAESSALLNLAAHARSASARAEALDHPACGASVVAIALRLAAALAEPSASPAAVVRCDATAAFAAAAVASPPGERAEIDACDALHPALVHTPRRPRSRRYAHQRSASPAAGALLALALPPSASLRTPARARGRPRRACARCGAVKTPQWRSDWSGPAGNKTLCNACGIRQRKTGDATPLRAPDTPPPLAAAEVV